MYHAVFPDEFPGFEAQFRYFRDHFKPVSLNQALDALERGRVDDSLLAITFDDGYEDNLTLAAPALEDHGMRG